LTKDKYLETPILFLVFNRPDTTKQVFESIRKVKPKQLFIAADGPRKERLGEFEKCEQVKSIVKNVDWNCEVNTLFRLENLGCGKAVSEAITWFFEQVEEGIILEDDCLPSDSFYKYCSELLQKYRDDNRIMHIGGNNFQDGRVYGDGSYYFSRIPVIWGWATWKRSWNKYDFILSTIEDNKVLNTISDTYNNQIITKFWVNCFNLVVYKLIDTWDYQWSYTNWYNNGVTVIPNFNLVKNIGFDDNATHTRDSRHKYHDLEVFDLKEIVHPTEQFFNEEADLFIYSDGFGLTLNESNKSKILQICKNIWMKLRNVLNS
jgi:hypothetical protein